MRVRVYLVEREASISRFASGQPTCHRHFGGHDTEQTLPGGDGKGTPSSSTTGQSGAGTEAPTSTGLSRDLAAESGLSQESAPSDLSRRVLELQTLLHAASSRKLTPDEQDAIAALIDHLRGLLGDDLNPI
jgi:hypothetical protein